MELKYRVCKTERGYLTHHYFLIEGEPKNFFSLDIDSAWNFFEDDILDVYALREKTGIEHVEFIEV